MTDESRKTGTPKELLKPTSEAQWGQVKEDHFGYKSEEERLTKRGLEDWELVEKIPESQANVPVWFIAVVVVVLLVAIGLSFPFWGDRPGYEREWFNWGFVAAIVYVTVGALFVYFMVRFYGSKYAGRLDTDPQANTPNTDSNKSKNAKGDE